MNSFTLNPETARLARRCEDIRRSLVTVAVANGAGHIAPSLSCVEILVALYYAVLKRQPDPLWPDRDRFVMSKGHGAYGLYAILADIGYISAEAWGSFYQGGPLKGCVERDEAHGLEAGTGALGHGLPIAVGMAYAARLQRRDLHVFCLVGDGELQEGSNWEAIQFAVKYQLSNLTLIVDANGLQAMDFLTNVLSPQDVSLDLEAKLTAFGMSTQVCDGHALEAVVATLAAVRNASAATAGPPSAVVAKTIKGYGVVAMENVPMFHFRVPTAGELSQGVRYES